MFDRFWLITLVFGLAFSGSIAWPQTSSENQPRQEESATNTEDGGESQNPYPEKTITALEEIEAAIRDLIAEEDKVEAQRREDAERRDLQAQEGMAWWAELMFYATAGTVLLTFVAMVAIIRTLHHTRRAADYSQKMVMQAEASTKAALDAVNVTREIGQAEVRAYFTVGKMRCKYIKTENGSDRFFIQVDFANQGNSPVESLKLTLLMALENNSGELVSNELKGEYKGVSTLQPRQSNRIDMEFGFTEGCHDAILKGEVVLSATLNVSYLDIFGNSYEWPDKRVVTGDLFKAGYLASFLA